MSSMEAGKWNNLFCAHIAKKCEEHELQSSTCLSFFDWGKKQTGRNSACFKYLTCFWAKLSAGSAPTRNLKLEAEILVFLLSWGIRDFICCLKM